MEKINIDINLLKLQIATLSGLESTASGHADKATEDKKERLQQVAYHLEGVISLMRQLLDAAEKSVK